MDEFLATPLGWGIFMGLLACLAAVVQGLSGFAFALTMVVCAMFFLPAKEVIPLVAFLATFNSFLLLWHWRKDVNVRHVLPIIIVAILCVPLGALFLKIIDREILIRLLGGTIVGLSMLSLFKSRVGKVFHHPSAKWIASVVSGLCSGAFSIGGPPLVVYAYNSSWPLKEARANLQLVFVTISSVACMTHFSTGLLTPPAMLKGVCFLPLVFVFGRLGSNLAQRISKEKLVLGINIFLMFIGFYYLIKG